MKSTKDNKKKNPHFSKEDANRKSSILFTQLGLVLALLLAYIAIEFKTPVNNDYADIPSNSYGFDDTRIPPDTSPEKPKPKKVMKSIPDPILDDPIIIKNDPKLGETVFNPKGLDPLTPVKKYTDFLPELPVDDFVVEDVPFKIIEYAPLFPGCKGTKEELKQCFSDSVTKLVTRKFNGDIAQEIGLSPGRKRIAVEFVVDKEGNIADVKVRAPHKRLEKETRRVINLLPQMSPGKQRGRAVGVRFMLPISFIVE